MDDNKDLKTPVDPEVSDPDTEDTKPLAEEAEDTAEDSDSEKDYSLDDFDDDSDAEEDDESDDEEDDELDELEELEDSEYEDEPAKKKPLIQKTIIISLVIVIIAVLAALVIKLFFDNDVTGTWKYTIEMPANTMSASSDEAATTEYDWYFTFKRDKTVTLTIGSISSVGTYEIGTNDEGKQTVTLDLYFTPSSRIMNLEFDYKVNGNIFTGKSLTLSRSVTSYTGQTDTEELDLKSATIEAPEIKRTGEFEKDEDLIGEWKYNEDEYSFTYQFNDDGTIRNTQKLQTNGNTYMGLQLGEDENSEPKIYEIDIDGLYSSNENTITIDSFFFEQNSRQILFKRDGDILYINDPALGQGYLPFTKDGSATVDQAARM